MKFSLLLFLFFFSACENKSKIPEDTLVKIYADITIVQDTTSGSSLKVTDINEGVFRKYNVTANDYKESIKRMESDPELWESFFKKVVDHVENLRKKEVRSKK